MNHPFRLLLIDDNPDDRTLAARKLEQEFVNPQIREIANVTELERALSQGNFDLVVTDYRLRWTDGLVILREVKQRYPDCPVVMFTGTGSEEIAVEAMKAGLDDYIIKSPNHYARLAVAVRTALNRARERQALQEVETRYQRLFEGMPVGLYRMTPTGQILDANPALLQIFGYADLATLLDCGKLEDHVEAEVCRHWQAQIRDRGEVRDFEMRMRHRDGTPIWIRHNARSIQDEAGEVMYYEGAIEDVTERKQVEAERAQLLAREQAARAEAETANRLKDEFLATLSHELRTPLNAMLGWVGLLRKQTLDPEKTARALEIVERNAQAQTQLIEDLLDVSRIIRGQLRLNVRPVDLQGIIEAALDTVQPAAEAKKIQVKSHIAPATGLVKGDPDRLQQIVWNLLSNAIKFTPARGRVSVHLEWLDRAVQICVKDTGKGLPPEEVPYVFERFRQVEGSTTRSHGGLGLGLAIVRHLVELHGGTVWCKSPGAGQGATFTVQLPLLTDDDGSKVRPEASAHSSAPASQPAPLDGLKILVVEDEFDSLEFIQMMLEDVGAKVTATRSVSEALQALARSQPDVLVSDIGMPGEDGYSLIRKVRNSNPKYHNGLPAIALTAYARIEDRQQALEAGFQMHLAKPIEPDDLVEAIAKLARQKP
jgi:PAS domain S-box-containing protein